MAAVSQAIFDPEVVAEWTRRRARHRHASRWLWCVFWIVLIVACLPLFFRLVDLFPYGVVLAFCATVAASTLKSRYMVILKCPHCDEAPVGRLVMPPLINAEHCPIAITGSFTHRWKRDSLTGGELTNFHNS